ncbi:hypothetical protein N7533_002583 [Penicillium manginii]|uniref:uncharacterized protein n=1 Tax=Penicillium manginii TaxID=203109 RepID=UPI002547EEF4|nr:uncharacterized protein N7533_002583 [Penicillium manginii]KAJ5763902.1 hypothetical protein N7533_002583 [Penicillium manginii]
MPIKRKAVDTEGDKKPSRAKASTPSPNDSTDRRILEKGKIEPILEPKRPEKFRPWPYIEKMIPVNDAEDLPENWHMNEDDLDT